MASPRGDRLSGPTSPSVGRTALSVAPVVILARGVAFLLPMAIAAKFGADRHTDAFFYALAFPSFLMVIVANAFGTTATPTLARVRAETPDQVPAFVGSAVVLASGAALAIGVAIILALVPLMPVITDFSPEMQAEAWRDVVMLLPYMVLVGTGVILRVCCEVHGWFVGGALAPLIRGSIAVTLVLALHAPLGVACLPVAYGVGQIGEVAWYLIVLGRNGLRPRFSMHVDPRLRSALRAIAPVLGGEVLVASNLVVDKAFAAWLPTGSLSILEYADRARFIPQTLAETTLLAVAFSTWSNQLARGDRDEYARGLDQSLRWLAALSAPVLGGLYVARFVILRWMYARGELPVADADAAADAFGWLMPGLWCMLLGALAMRAHVAEGRLSLVFWFGILSVGVNALLDGVLLRFGVNGLAISSTLTWFIVPAAYLLALWPRLRPVATAARWGPVALVALGSLGTAILVETQGAPVSLADAELWLASVPFFALLGLAWWTTRPR